MRDTTIYCSSQVRSEWPRVQAPAWLRQYPQLFDRDDLRLALSQQRNHFSEWFAAIHLFQRDGVRALVEKYAFEAHPAKVARMRRLLDEQDRDRLDALCAEHQCQPPDLLLYTAKNQLAGFAEVKGPGDRLKPKQASLIRAIERRFAVPVDFIRVKLIRA